MLETTPSLTESSDHDSGTDISLAAGILFDEHDNTVKFRGREVRIYPATMKQLPLLMKFFQRILDALDKRQLADLIDLFATAQRAAISAGKDPSKVDLSFLTSEEVVGKALGNVSLLMALLAASLEIVPELIATFASIDEDEFGDLTADEGALVVGTVFLVNYHFFSRSLPPTLMVFTKLWASKNSLKDMRKGTGKATP